jgi:hypothetical protein
MSATQETTAPTAPAPGPTPAREADAARARPLLADGVELLGRQEGSGFEQPPSWCVAATAR